MVSAGNLALESTILTPTMELLNALQFETVTPWDSVRHDALTARMALAYLDEHKPRLLYIALDETDDWAHDGRYDRVLQSLHRTDNSLRSLWTFVQASNKYRDKNGP